MAVTECNQLDVRIGGEQGAGMGLKLGGAGAAGIRIPVARLRLADKASQRTRPIRMYVPERVTGRFTADDPLEYAVPEVPVTQTIAVRQERGLAADLCGDWTVDELNADLIGQEVSTPRVVISADKTDANASIDKLGQCLQGSKVPTEHDRAIFEPEIEQIAVDHEIAGGAPYEREEIMKRIFTVSGGGAEVGVRNNDARELAHGPQYTEVR